MRALNAIVDVLEDDPREKPSSADILVDGERVTRVPLPAATASAGPFTVDLSALLKPGAANLVTVVVPHSSSTASAQLVAAWYQPWSGPRTSPAVAIMAEYSKTRIAPNEVVQCDVTVSRPGFRGYGMMIAEIGLPPDAEVDRGTLDDAVARSHGVVSAYEVLPDHVVVYAWPRKSAGARIRFAFRPRYPIRARTAASAVYDYYNPEARAVVPPVMFTVE